MYIPICPILGQKACGYRLKHCAHMEFQLVNNRLVRRPDFKFLNLRYTVAESMTFDIIANEHLQYLHTGYIKTWATIQQKNYGITRQEVVFVIKLCKNCATIIPANSSGFYISKVNFQNTLNYIH